MHRFSILVLLALTAGAANAASPVVYDANDLPLGVWIQSHGGEQETLLTRTGYCVGMTPRTGGFVIPECFFQVAGLGGDLLFESTDCTGPSYGPADEFVRGGFVAPGPSGTLRYSPRGEVPALRSIQSKRNAFGQCSAEVGTVRTIAVLQNDESVTGIPATLALPIELRVEERCVFADGFECAN
jgi:hypothetical protein